MEAVAIAIIVAAAVPLIVGKIWILIEMFRENHLWGLAGACVPGVYLYWTATRWNRAKKPFCLIMAGLAFVIVGAVIHAASAGSG